jgi:fluoride exporter
VPNVPPAMVQRIDDDICPKHSATVRAMNMLLAIAVGGAVGALGRHFVNVGVAAWIGLGIPWGTLTVNIVGSFAMGVLVHIMATTWSVTPEIRALLTVGGLGAFTTFSTFSLDAIVLYERGQVMFAAGYVLASVVGAIGALFIGLRLARVVFA